MKKNLKEMYLKTVEMSNVTMLQYENFKKSPCSATMGALRSSFRAAYKLFEELSEVNFLDKIDERKAYREIIPYASLLNFIGDLTGVIEHKKDDLNVITEVASIIVLRVTFKDLSDE